MPGLIYLVKPWLRLAILTILGCFVMSSILACKRGANNDPVSDFRAKHPSDSKHYIYILPIKSEVIAATFDSGHIPLMFCGQNLKRKFGKFPDVDKFADKVLAEYEAEHTNWNQMIASLDRQAGKDGVTCSYKFNDGKTEKFGYLSILHGDISFADSFIEREIEAK